MGSTFVTVLIRYSRAAEKLPNKPTRKNIFPILIVTVVLCDKSIKVYFFYKTLIRKDFHFVLIDNFVYFLFTYLEVNCTCSISIVSVTNPVAIKLFISTKQMCTFFSANVSKEDEGFINQQGVHELFADILFADPSEWDDDSSMVCEIFEVRKIS